RFQPISIRRRILCRHKMPGHRKYCVSELREEAVLLFRRCLRFEGDYEIVKWIVRCGHGATVAERRGREKNPVLCQRGIYRLLVEGCFPHTLGRMTRSRHNEAVALHRRLTETEWLLLRESGIPAAVAYERLLGWNGKHITIPVFSYDRKVLSFEHATWSDDDLLEVVPQKGGKVALYGLHLLRSAQSRIILTEGIVESLVLAGQSFAALSATGSGHSFKEEWVPLLRGVREVFVCFKRSP